LVKNIFQDKVTLLSEEFKFIAYLFLIYSWLKALDDMISQSVNQ